MELLAGNKVKLACRGGPHTFNLETSPRCDKFDTPYGLKSSPLAIEQLMDPLRHCCIATGPDSLTKLPPYTWLSDRSFRCLFCWREPNHTTELFTEEPCTWFIHLAGSRRPEVGCILL